MKQSRDGVSTDSCKSTHQNFTQGINKKVMKPRVIQVASASFKEETEDIHQIKQEVLERNIVLSTNPSSVYSFENKEADMSNVKQIPSPLSKRPLKNLRLKYPPCILDWSKRLCNLSPLVKEVTKPPLIPIASVSPNNYSPEVILKYSKNLRHVGRNPSITQFEISSAGNKEAEGYVANTTDGNQEDYLCHVGKSWGMSTKKESVIGPQITASIFAPNTDFHTIQKPCGIPEVESYKRNPLTDVFPDEGSSFLLSPSNEDCDLQANAVYPSSSDDQLTRNQGNSANNYTPSSANNTFRTNRTITASRATRRHTTEMENQNMRKIHWLNIGFMTAGTIMLGLVCLSCALFTKDIFSALIFITSGIVIIGIISSTLYYLKRRTVQFGTIYKSSPRTNYRSSLSHSLPAVN